MTNEQTTVPLIAKEVRHSDVEDPGSDPDATHWGFLKPIDAERSCWEGWTVRPIDGLTFLARDCSKFAASIVRNHFYPTPGNARDVRICGDRAAEQIVSMVRQALTDPTISPEISPDSRAIEEARTVLKTTQGLNGEQALGVLEDLRRILGVTV